MASERLDIIISAVGGQAAASEISSIGGAAEKTTSLLGFLRAALVAIAAVEIVTQFTEMADVFTNVQNRLVLVTNGVQQANNVFNGLYAVAQQTRQPLEATADVFTRVARSAEGQTLTFNQLLDVTKGLNETLLLSGASGTRAKQGLTELAEGLGLGVLQGRQLRALITDIPELANVIGKKVGIAGSQLFEFAQQNPGKLTPDLIIKAIEEALTELQARLARTGLTFGQTFDRMANSLDVFLGRLAQGTGAAQKLDTVLQFIVAHAGQIVAALAAFAGIVAFNFIVGQALALGTALAGVFGIVTRLLSVFGLILVPFQLFRTIAIAIGAITFLPLAAAFSLISGIVVAMANPVKALAAAFDLLKVAVLTNPLFLTGAAVIAAAVVAFYVFHDQITGIVNSLGGISGIWNTIVNGAAAAVTVIIAEWRQLPAVFDDIGNQITQKLVNAWTTAKDKATLIMEGLKHPLSATIDVLNGTPSPPAPATTPPVVANPEAGAAQGLLDDFNKNFAARQATGTNVVNTGIEAAIAKGKQMVASLTSLTAGTGGAENAGASGSDHPQSSGDVADLDALSKKAQSLLASVSPLIALQQKMADTSKAVGEASRYYADQVTFLTQQIDAGKDSDGHYAKNLEQVRQNQQLLSTVMGDTERKTAGLSTSTDQYAQKFQVLNQVLKDGKISQEEYNQTIQKDSIAFLATQTDAQSGVARTFLKMQEQTADAASGIEKALTGAFDAANDAVVQFVTTGKVQITDLANTIESGLLKQALTGLEGDFGAQLGFGSKQGGNGAVASIFNGIKGLIPGLGGSSGDPSSKGGMDKLNDIISGSGLTSAQGMPVYVTNAAGGIPGLGGGSNPLAGAEKAASPDGSGGGFFDSIGSFFKGAGSDVSDILSKIGGGIESGASSLASGAGSLASEAGPLISSLFGYASGGSFQVGAGTSLGDTNGTDNRLIAFRARDGETVSVTPPGQRSGGSGVTVIQNINTPDASSFRASQGQQASGAYVALARATRRNNMG
jgi:lambda family phage tail tape measure protein